MLTGDYPRLHRMRRMWGALPAPPRCKLCNAPFRGFGGALMRAIAYGPSPLNRRLCKWCIRAVSKHPGGAEIEISVLFADVRGSTGLAEEMAPEEFSRLLARFYGTAAEVIDECDGIVDKFVGDEAIGLFIPGFTGARHAAKAISAGRAILEAAGRDGASEAGPIPVGGGIHTGIVYVGSLGSSERISGFTALGDSVNTSARLASLAGPGELLVSVAAGDHAGLDASGLERRTVEVRGREAVLDVYELRATSSAEVAGAG